MVSSTPTIVHKVFSDGRLYPSAQDVEYWPWDLISPGQWRMFDRLNGNVFVHDASMSGLQNMCELLGKRLTINSGHRGPLLNAKVGGAPLSAHKNIAFDIPLVNVENPIELLDAALFSGFRSFGLYKTFVHVDVRPGRGSSYGRFWYGKGAKPMWDELGVTGRSFLGV